MAEIGAREERDRDRDQLLVTCREVLSEVPEQDRGRLMDVCIGSIPAKFSFIDGVNMISMLSRSGLVGLTNEHILFAIKQAKHYLFM